MTDNLNYAITAANRDIFLDRFRTPSSGPPDAKRRYAELTLDLLIEISNQNDWNEDRKPLAWPSSGCIADRFGVSASSIRNCLRSIADSGLITCPGDGQAECYTRDRVQWLRHR